MAKANSDITFASARGGFNDSDPPSHLPLDQCVEAVNVEFNRSTLGERRRGAAAVTITGSGLEDRTHLSFLHRHLPTADETAAELWALAVSAGVSSRLSRKTTSWNEVTQNDTIGIAGVEGFRVVGQSLHGKLFLAHKSAVDRLHCYDGTSLRRVGMAAPAAAPTGANVGSGSMSGTRYYRTRETVQVSSVTTLRSEPSAVLTHTPSSHASVTVTKPATINVSPNPTATHWEVEASLDNVNFYRVSTVVIGTTTYSDTVLFGVGYASNTLSEDSGDYTVPPSCKFLSADEDRLLMAGSWETSAQASRVSWTPVFGDPGVGNDERIPIDTDNFIDLDGSDGGEITALSDVVNGYVFAFKANQTYKLVRSGQRAKAYTATLISKQRGAIYGSVVEGVDQAGSPCLYFLDPSVGPCRIGANGVQICSADIQTTWRRVNVNATTVTCTGVYYPDSKQVHWWVAVDGGNTPTLKLVLQTNETRDGLDGVRRGWSTATGPSATAISACLFATNINDNAARNLTLRPFIGLGGAAASILRLDTGTDDNGTAYYAHITSRPYALAGILNKFGVMAGALLAKAATGITVYVKAIADYGLNDKTVSALLTAAGSESYVNKPFDNLSLGEMKSLQLEYGDDPDELVAPVGDWEINVIAFKSNGQETA